MYLRPFLTYTAMTTVFGLVTLLRDDASLLARGSAVIAACLMCAIAFHAAVFCLSLWASLAGHLSPLYPAFFALTTLRAALMPQLERWRGQRTTPKHVGITEFAIIFILLLVLAGG